MFLAQMPPQPLPELPEGPSLDSVREPVEIPLLETWQWSLIIGVSAVLLYLIVSGIARWIQRRKHQKMPPRPDTIALNLLEQIAKDANADDNQFAVESSFAIRRYLETEWQFSALGRTTEEFLNSLRKDQALLDEERALLEQLLKQCDKIKFARQTITQSDRSELTGIARKLVSTLHRRKFHKAEGGKRS